MTSDRTPSPSSQMPGGGVRAVTPTNSRRAGPVCPAGAGTGPGRWSGPWCWRRVRERAASDRCRELARRKPILVLRLSGVFLLRVADRQLCASLFQLPPRITRLVPLVPLAPKMSLSSFLLVVGCPLLVAGSSVGTISFHFQGRSLEALWFLLCQRPYVPPFLQRGARGDFWSVMKNPPRSPFFKGGGTADLPFVKGRERFGGKRYPFTINS
jgi:hypothetical protein